MNKKLWLDDERPAPEGWIHTKTAWEAIYALSLGVFDEVSFDHDLGDALANGTGYDAVCWLEERAMNDPSFMIPIVHIHTANPSARAKMVQAADNIELHRRMRNERESS